MRIRKKKWAEPELSVCDFFVKNPEEYAGKWQSAFKKEQPLVLEIGCGKGKFACEYAKAHPEQNVIAVEKYGNVIVEACERAIEDGIDNLYFIKGNAEYLPKYIKDGSVERIFLNFSCPFPKNKYAIHRLTHHRFLSIYRLLLCEGGEIHQKTDNMHFFEFSIEEFSQNGFALKNVSLDLHRSGFEDNIMTEYEARFSSMGMPIYRLEAYIK